MNIWHAEKYLHHHHHLHLTIKVIFFVCFLRTRSKENKSCMQWTETNERISPTVAAASSLCKNFFGRRNYAREKMIYFPQLLLLVRSFAQTVARSVSLMNAANWISFSYGLLYNKSGHSKRKISSRLILPSLSAHTKCLSQNSPSRKY